jgi:hypothetical protein
VFKLIHVCAAAAVVVAFSSAAVAQDPGAQPATPQGPAASSPSAAVPYLGPGTYSSYGNQTYGQAGWRDGGLLHLWGSADLPLD